MPNPINERFAIINPYLSHLRQPLGVLTGLVPLHRVVLFLAFSAYLFFGLQHIELPGVQYDEMAFVNAALGDVDGTFVDWKVKVGPLDIPVMVMGYIGALKAWIYAPVFALFGTSPATARIPVVLLGLVTLFGMYLLTSRMFGRHVGVISSVLTATDPTFIFAHKLDWGPVALMSAFKIGALWCCWRWLERGRIWYSALAGFLLGLGLFDKIIFIWYVAALVSALALCYWTRIKTLVNRRTLWIPVLSFLLGCFPLIAFNIHSPLTTFAGQRILARDVPLTEDLWYRYLLFRMTLDGYAIQDYINAGEPLGPTLAQDGDDALATGVAILHRHIPFDRTLGSWGLATALVMLAFLSRHGVVRKRGREILLIALLLVFVSIFVVVSAQGTGPHHVFMLYPFNNILTGFVFEALWRIARSKTLPIRLPLLVGIVLSMAILLYAQLFIDFGYLKSFVLKGGVGAWSDAIYDLADYARSRPDKTLILMDWGFSMPLLLLSQGEQRKAEAFFTTADKEEKGAGVKAMYPYLIAPDALLVFHTLRFETVRGLDLFRRSLPAYGLEARVARVFSQRNGEPVYNVFEVIHPEIEEFVDSGRLFLFREAEKPDEKSGGGVENRNTASLRSALGSSWGARESDFATYIFRIARPAKDVYFNLRYSLQGTSNGHLRLNVDGTDAAMLELQPASGSGAGLAEWRLSRLRLGDLKPGLCKIHIQPTAERWPVTLDYVYLSEHIVDLRHPDIELFTDVPDPDFFVYQH